METSKVKLSEKVPNYIIQGRNFGGDFVNDYYESGNLLIFDNFVAPPFLKWLWRNTKVLVDADIQFKKLKSSWMLDSKIEKKTHVLWNFTDKPKDLQEKIRKLYKQVKIFAYKFFPKYNIVDENWTWRFTETREDEMHLDSYGDQNNDLHNLRIFVNLDNKARIWRTSYSVQDILEYYNSKSLYTPGLHPNQLNDVLNSYICCDKLPYHEIEFAPGSMWIVNSQIISHQGWYGNRMAGYTFRISPESMYYPEMNFVNVVMRKLEQLNGLRS